MNAFPHVGHALEYVQADTMARYRRLCGLDVWFLTGTDENAQKNVVSAEVAGIPPQEFVNKNTAEFQETLNLLDISNSDFIRTTDKVRHWPGVEEFWNRCLSSGDIYKKEYTGLYCKGCEAFLTEKDLIDGVCPEHNAPPENIAEVNYFFRLSRYQKELEDLIERGELSIVPSSRKNEILSFIQAGLEDFSVSRPAERVQNWGIPVPRDPTQVIYVWFDALVNYLTALGFGKEDHDLLDRFWPADLHVIGKGIVRFHAVYWPAMLLSAGITLPRNIFVHSYITVEGAKMSKTAGNVLAPSELVKSFGVDAVRYYLLRGISPFTDGNFSTQDLVTRNDREFLAIFGNFCYRTLSFIARAFGNTIPQPEILEEEDTEVLDAVRTACTRSGKNIESFRFIDGIQELLNAAGWGNRYFQEKAPWSLVKENFQRAGTVLFVCTEICRRLAISLHPFVPGCAERLWNQLGLKGTPITHGWDSIGKISVIPGTLIPRPEPLLQKLENLQ